MPAFVIFHLPRLCSWSPWLPPSLNPHFLSKMPTDLCTHWNWVQFTVDSMANYYRLKSVLTILTSVPLCLFLAKVKFSFYLICSDSNQICQRGISVETISSKISKDLLLWTISRVHQTFCICALIHCSLEPCEKKTNKQQLRMWTQCVYIQGSCLFCYACQAVQYKALLTF